MMYRNTLYLINNRIKPTQLELVYSDLFGLIP